MTKVVYLECPTGIAGNMCLGALVDAGVPLDYLTTMLDRLGVSDEFQLRKEAVQRNGQQATQVHVDLTPAAPGAQAAASESQITETASAPHTHSHAHTHHHGPGRHLPEIEGLIQAANLPKQAAIWSLAVFRRLAAAEAAVHGIPPEAVHFHEVGATDAIVDIVGTCLGLDWLGVERIYASPLPVGGGTVRAAHGRLPVPAPAVLKLWEMRQVPVYSNGIARELVTPTGAAIATTLATQFGPPPAMTLLRVGLGAGSHQLPLPNILRLWIGAAQADPALSRQPQTESSPAAQPGEDNLEAIALLETQVDDLNPQAIGYLYETLFAAGALDVFTSPIAMKKSRPGTLLTVLCSPDQLVACEAVLFRETTTLGIRRQLQHRRILHRALEPVETPYGAVRVKVARPHPTAPPLNVQPEYEDCAQLARTSHQPWREIHRLAVQAWYAQHSATPSPNAPVANGHAIAPPTAPDIPSAD